MYMLCPFSARCSQGCSDVAGVLTSSAGGARLNQNIATQTALISKMAAFTLSAAAPVAAKVATLRSAPAARAAAPRRAVRAAAAKVRSPAEDGGCRVRRCAASRHATAPRRCSRARAGLRSRARAGAPAWRGSAVAR
jgi:hypothetical protein